MENSYQISQLELVKPIHLKQLILYWKNEKEWAHRTVASRIMCKWKIHSIFLS